MQRLTLSLGVSLLVLAGCASGKRWVGETGAGPDRSGSRILLDGKREKGETGQSETVSIGPTGDRNVDDEELADAPGERPKLSLTGTKPVPDGPVDGQLLGVFRNTYYDFPAEADFTGKPVPLMSRSCQPIRSVPKGFYDAVCVQGSGTLTTGTTVSFAKRDCSCASVCERTGQRICFDELDRASFPWGRGALGKAITPLRTVAVDSSVVPLGTPLYILELDGVPRQPGGTPLDGCFVAEDRGMKVQGQHVDIFTGNASITGHLNSVVPSNVGVHVYVGTARGQAQ
jgi:3D (Asp-Asp-Asp) domain-containing protein